MAEAAVRFAAVEPGTLVVAAAEDPDHFLGTVGWAFHVPEKLRIADIGYSVHPDSRGRGVATRAIRTLTRWLTRGPPTDLGWHGCSSTTAWRTMPPAGWRWPPASNARASGAATCPFGTRTLPDGERRHDVCMHGVRRQRLSRRPCSTYAVHSPLTSPSPPRHGPEPLWPHAYRTRHRAVRAQHGTVAHVTREVVSRLTDGGHDVVVFAGGRGQATFRGRPPVLGQPDDPGLGDPRGPDPLPPRRLPPHRPAPAGHQGRRGRRPARRTDRGAAPPHLEARASTSPTTTPACATRTCTTAGRGCTPPTGAGSWSATSARSSARRCSTVSPSSPGCPAFAWSPSATAPGPRACGRPAPR